MDNLFVVLKLIFMLIDFPFKQFVFLIHLIHLLIQLYHLMPKKIPLLLQIKHFLIRPFLHHFIIQLCPQLFQLLEHFSDLLFQGIHINLLDQLYAVLNLRVYVLSFIEKYLDECVQLCNEGL